MNNQNSLSQKYFDRFARKDLNGLEGLFSDQITLQDPIVGKICGKKAVLSFYRDFFDKNEFQIEILRQFVNTIGSKSSYAAEFRLSINPNSLNKAIVWGIDCIEVQDGLIESVRAYLDASRTADPS